MNAHIIAIGDEILIGDTINTNASFIGQQLNSIGVDVVKTSVISDDHDIIVSEFSDSIKKFDFTICTGGLGPTHDDKTLRCVSEIYNSSLIVNEEVLKNVRERFEKRGLQLTKINEDQALVPENSEVIRNPNGTAPGIWINKDGKFFCVMPGVPYEMKAMVEDFVIPKIKSLDLIKIKKSTLNLFTTGIPESMLFERLGDLDELLDGAKIAFLPNLYGVKLRTTVEGIDEEEQKNKLLEIEQRIRSKVGRYIYSKEDEFIEDVVGRLLNDRSLKIATAESCTGGLIASRLTNVPGSSEFFERGLVTYSNGAKVELLNVSEDVILEKGAVSFEVARQMADGVKSSCGTDIGLAVTGIMGPSGGTPEKPVGLVFIGLCDEKMCTAKEFKLIGNRVQLKARTSQAALDMLRRNLLGIPYDE